MTHIKIILILAKALHCLLVLELLIGMNFFCL